MMVNGTVVKHWSKTQASRALSSAEAEDHAVVRGGADGLGMQSMVIDLGLQSIVAALATSLHHSSRGQKKARAGEEESELNCTAAVRKTPPSQPVLFSLYDEETGGRRPASQRHTWEHIVDFVCFAPMVQFLRHAHA